MSTPNPCLAVPIIQLEELEKCNKQFVSIIRPHGPHHNVTTFIKEGGLVDGKVDGVSEDDSSENVKKKKGIKRACGKEMCNMGCVCMSLMTRHFPSRYKFKIGQESIKEKKNPLFEDDGASSDESENDESIDDSEVQEDPPQEPLDRVNYEIKRVEDKAIFYDESTNTFHDVYNVRWKYIKRHEWIQADKMNADESIQDYNLRIRNMDQNLARQRTKAAEYEMMTYPHSLQEFGTKSTDPKRFRRILTLEPPGFPTWNVSVGEADNDFTNWRETPDDETESYELVLQNIGGKLWYDPRDKYVTARLRDNKYDPYTEVNNGPIKRTETRNVGRCVCIETPKGQFCGATCSKVEANRECIERSHIEKNCGNVCVTLGITPNCQLFTTSNMGLGVKALERITRGTFIGEYIGDAVHNADFDDIPSSGSAYVCLAFDNVWIDAKDHGNLTKFINHSCSPNTMMKDWALKDYFTIIFLAIKDIEQGEEITVNYGEDYFKGGMCICGSDKCTSKLLETTSADPQESEEAILPLGAEILKIPPPVDDEHNQDQTNQGGAPLIPNELQNIEKHPHPAENKSESIPSHLPFPHPAAHVILPELSPALSSETDKLGFHKILPGRLETQPELILEPLETSKIQDQGSSKAILSQLEGSELENSQYSTEAPATITSSSIRAQKDPLHVPFKLNPPGINGDGSSILKPSHLKLPIISNTSETPNISEAVVINGPSLVPSTSRINLSSVADKVQGSSSSNTSQIDFDHNSTNQIIEQGDDKAAVDKLKILDKELGGFGSAPVAKFLDKATEAAMKLGSLGYEEKIHFVCRLDELSMLSLKEGILLREFIKSHHMDMALLTKEQVSFWHKKMKEYEKAILHTNVSNGQGTESLEDPERTGNDQTSGGKFVGERSTDCPPQGDKKSTIFKARKAKSAAGPSKSTPEVIVISSTDEEDFLPTPKPKAKLQPKPKSIPKKIKIQEDKKACLAQNRLRSTGLIRVKPLPPPHTSSSDDEMVSPGRVIPPKRKRDIEDENEEEMISEESGKMEEDEEDDSDEMVSAPNLRPPVRR